MVACNFSSEIVWSVMFWSTRKEDVQCDLLRCIKWYYWIVFPC